MAGPHGASTACHHDNVVEPFVEGWRLEQSEYASNLVMSAIAPARSRLAGSAASSD